MPVSWTLSPWLAYWMQHKRKNKSSNEVGENPERIGRKKGDRFSILRLKKRDGGIENLPI